MRFWKETPPSKPYFKVLFETHVLHSSQEETGLRISGAQASLQKKTRRTPKSAWLSKSWNPKNANWDQAMTQQILKNPIFVVRKWPPRRGTVPRSWEVSC